MKIGIDARAAKWYRGTGIGTYTYQLINSLNKIDVDNDYLLFMPQQCNSEIRFNKNFGIQSITKNMQGNFWDEVNIPNILKDQNIQLYHVPQNGIGIPNNKSCPFVITLHDIIPYRMPQTVGENYLKIFTEQMPDIIKKCDGIITVSNFSKNDITKAFNFPKEKIFVTYLASEDIYKPISKSYCKHLINKYYSINGDFILYIGGFSPRKNILGLIEAFYKLISFYKKDIKLIIAGKQGISYPSYKEAAEKLNIGDKVIFPGFIPIEHLPCFYNAASLFAYPSFYEGFGLPPIEAMACGTPVVASNVTSLPEIIKDAGIMVDPHDTSSLSMAMLKVLEDENFKNKLIKNGFARAANLSWQNTTYETINAYKSLMD